MDIVNSMFAKRLKEALQKNNMRAADLCEKTKIGKSAISQYMSGAIMPKQERLGLIANALDVSVAYLMGWDDAEIVPTELWQFDVVGKIAAGYDHEPIMTYTGEKTSIPAIPGYNKDELIVCEIFGTSMWPQFIEGDKVIVRLTPSVSSGDIACVMVGDEATIKRVVYEREGETEQFMELIPINPEYPTKRVTGEMLNSCRVIGKVIKLMRDV